MKMTRILTLLLLGLTGGYALQGAAEVTVHARFYCLDVAGDGIGGLVYQNEKTAAAIRVPSGYLSQIYEYAGPPLLSFYESAALAASDGKSLPAAYASVLLPETGGEFLILFGRSEGAPRLVAVPFGRDAVPDDGYLFWNLTARQLGVMLGSHRVVLAPGGRQTVALARDTDYQALRIFEATSGGSQQVFASRHLHRPDTRQIVFIRDSERSDRVKIRMISQTPPPPEPVPAGAR